MNFYDHLYFNIYKSLSRTNKSIPEWSTIIVICILFWFNLLSVTKIAEINIMGLDKQQVYVAMGVIFGIHYLYFLFKNRITKKIERQEPKTNFLSKALTMGYVLGTFSLFSYITEMKIEYYLILVLGIISTTAITHYFYKEDKKTAE